MLPSFVTTLLPIAWIVLVLAALPQFQRHRGVLVAVLVGMLFLPQVGAHESAKVQMGSVIGIGPIQFGKDYSISYALLLIVLLYDFPLLVSSRPGWVDLPMLVWCLCPIASALTNEPPPDGGWAIRDGLYGVIGQMTQWGFPYVAGRLYFTDKEAFRDLALGIVLAAVIYCPLCLWEVRFSPMLHAQIFGFLQHEFGQTIRFGGYRPMVFFIHGLVLAFWMVNALLIAAWLAWSWREDAGKGFMRYSLLVLLPTIVLLKSTGAILLGLAGLVILLLGKVVPSRVWLFLLMAMSPLYVTLRVSGIWNGRVLVELSQEFVGEDRAQSLEFRMDNEDLLIEKALKQPTFGWGGWGRSRVFDENDRDITVTDGLWIIYLGNYGFLGLLSLGAILLLPAFSFMMRFPLQCWKEDAIAPVLVCIVLLLLLAIEFLPNASLTPLNPLMAGALAGLDPKRFLEVKQLTLAARGNRPPAVNLGLPARRANVVEVQAQ